MPTDWGILICQPSPGATVAAAVMTPCASVIIWSAGWLASVWRLVVGRPDADKRYDCVMIFYL